MISSAARRAAASLTVVIAVSLSCQTTSRAVPQRGAAAAGSITPAAPMRIARAAHTATALADGQVLIAGGGTDAMQAAASAELFDPANGRFAELPPMLTLRHSHTATRLPNGTVLIAGGYTTGSAYSASAELYDPATKTFSATGSMHTARAGQVAVLLGNGKVLVAGGVGTGWTFLSSAELYDPATGAFTPAGEMTVPRESHVAVLLNDGRVLVVGGHRGRRADIELYTSAEAYDPATNRFTKVGDMQVRRHKHDAVLLNDGRVMVTGGSDERDDRGAYDSTELFDPATGAFTMGPTMRLARYKHQGSMIVLPNGSVLIGGGAQRAEIYDPAKKSFELVAGDSRMAGQFGAVAALPDGGALITGGYGEGTGLRETTWRYRR